MPVVLDNKKIIEGINIVCDAVKTTLGAEGGTVIIDGQLHPQITADGVTICREIHLEDKLQNMGASLVQEAALKVVKEEGDGTSTTCVVTQALVNGGQDLIDTHHTSHVAIREGVLKAKEDVIEMLYKLSRKTTKADIKRVAKVSSNGDKVISDLIAKAYNSISADGMIEVIGTSNEETTLEINEGLKLDKGWSSPNFITDPVKLTSVLTNVKILVVDGNIPDDMKLLLPAIKECQETGSSLFIICDEIHNTTLGSLIKNKMSKALMSCVIKNPFYGRGRLEILQDLEAYTGAKMLKVGVDDSYVLGNAERVVVNENETIVQRNEQIEGLEEYISLVKSQEDNELKQKRLSNLSSNLATIFVGSPTPSEMSELKDRCDDAVLAVKSALSSGVNAGGGSTLYYISKQLKSTDKGYNLLLKAIQAPYEQILKNAGINKTFFKPLPKIKTYGEVYNVRTKKIEGMEVNGILDSTKVLKTVLESSVSVALLVLSTKATITIDRK